VKHPDGVYGMVVNMVVRGSPVASSGRRWIWADILQMYLPMKHLISIQFCSQYSSVPKTRIGYQQSGLGSVDISLTKLQKMALFKRNAKAN
jgi:hypothetical protein